jgi:death on curing protein
MKDIIFLNKDQILQLHKKAIEDYGGSTGLRDNGLLESAIAQPEASFGGAFLHENLFHMAAAYFFHISQNQPFIDGNKRTGFLALFTFLKINGYSYNASNEITYPFLIEVAEGRKNKEDLAHFVELYSISIA